MKSKLMSSIYIIMEDFFTASSKEIMVLKLLADS